MLYLNKIKARVRKCMEQDWLGGEFIQKQYKFLKFSFKRKLLPKCEKFCDTFYKNGAVYLSVTAIINNEAPYIKEWIEYHKLAGVDRFYIYDNGSTDNIKEVLQPYIDAGIVFYHFAEGDFVQNKVYRDAVYKYKNQTRWMAFIDLDEFIVPVEKSSIPEFLKDYEEYPAVAVNWQVFDSNGFDEPPVENGGLITANYIRTYANEDEPINRHVKSIVDPKRVVSVNNPHFCYYKFDKLPVDENFQKVYGPFTTKHTSSKIKINHYFSKSRAEYMVKVYKQCADSERKRVLDERTINIPEWKYDYAIQKFVPELMRRMGI